MACVWSITRRFLVNLFLNQWNVKIPTSKFIKPVERELLNTPKKGNNKNGKANDAKNAPK